jgi:hypothetical protein
MPPYLALYFIIYAGNGATPTPTPTPTDTPTTTPTATPTGIITPTATITPVVTPQYLSAYTYTLSSDNVLTVPVSVSFGEALISGSLLLLSVVLVIKMMFGRKWSTPTP